MHFSMMHLIWEKQQKRAPNHAQVTCINKPTRLYSGVCKLTYKRKIGFEEFSYRSTLYHNSLRY